VELSWFKKIKEKVKSFFKKEDKVPAGIEIYNEQNKLILGTNYRGLRLLKMLKLQDLKGSTSVTPKNGEEILAFAVLHCSDTVWHYSDIKYCNVNGHTISWEFSEGNASSAFGSSENGRINVYIFGRAK